VSYLTDGSITFSAAASSDNFVYILPNDTGAYALDPNRQVMIRFVLADKNPRHSFRNVAVVHGDRCVVNPTARDFALVELSQRHSELRSTWL
jgi:hypothetical protein